MSIKKFICPYFPYKGYWPLIIPDQAITYIHTKNIIYIIQKSIFFIYFQKTVAIGWILSNMAFWISYYCVYDVIHNLKSDALKSATYQTFLRLLWSINISWIIFACHQGYGGLINRFLSYRVWQPTSRLSFNIYIIHISVITFFIAKSRGQFYFDDLFLFRRYIGDLGISILVAGIWSLAFEQPFNRLFDFFTKSKR